MDTKARERRLFNGIVFAYIAAGVFITVAFTLVMFFMLEVWLISFSLALLGIAFFMAAFALGSESERKRHRLFALTIIIGALGLFLLGYGLYRWF